MNPIASEEDIQVMVDFIEKSGQIFEKQQGEIKNLRSKFREERKWRGQDKIKIYNLKRELEILEKREMKINDCLDRINLLNQVISHQERQISYYVNLLEKTQKSLFEKEQYIDFLNASSRTHVPSEDVLISRKRRKTSRHSSNGRKDIE